jgi:DNA-binding CsgD family transcriptional regulator
VEERRVQFIAGDEVIARDTELSGLSGAVAGLAEGRGGTAWIQGEAGIGKSVLIEAVLARAPAGGTVLRAAGDELTAAFPLRMLADCLGVSRHSPDPARAALAALLRGDDAAGGQHRPGASGPAADGLLDLVRAACQQGPVVLAGDDLQWADEASLALWPLLIELTARFPLLLLGAARPAPARAAAAGLPGAVRRQGGLVLTLGPLEDDSAGRLAERRLGVPPGPALRTELRRAGGNPAYLRELVGALDGAGLIEVTDGVAEFRGEPGVMPPSLAASVDRKLGFLGTEARAAVRMAAMLSGEVTAADLAAVTGRTPTVIAAALSEAAGSGVIASPEGPVTFRHELVRQALASQVPAAVSPALHQHAARALAASGRRMEAVARHLLAGPLVMDDWALRWLARRSETSLYQVPRAAVELLETAIQSLDEADPRWEAFASRLAQASFWLGRDDGVVPVALEVARRTTDVDLACRMRIFAMRSAVRTGRYADGISLGESALKARGLTDAWRAKLGSWLAVLLLLSGQPRRGDAKAFDALRHAALASDPLATAAAHQAAALGSGTVAAVAHADSALAALGSDAESADLRLSLLRNRLIWLERLDDAEELERTLAVALREADRAAVFESVGILGAAADARYRQGRWDEVLSYLARIAPEFRDHDHAVRLRAVAALIAVHRGEQADAAAHLCAAGRAAQQPPDSMQPGDSHYITACALAAEADGDLAGAVRAVAGWLEVPASLRRHLACDDAPDLVRLALAAGEPGLARDVVAVLEADAAADPVPGRTLAARCGRAQAAGDPDGLLAAAADYQRRGWSLRQGVALEEAAVRLAESGQRERAAAVLAEAVDAYALPAAAWDSRRAEARLRPLGVRRGPRSAHRRTEAGWAALTPAEDRVARMAAGGLSNADIATRLFLSQRTVHAHVSRILAKLQLRSRAELARALAEHERG